MSEQARGSHGQLKRPYERPRLESSEIFGAEAAWGSCCRRTNATCSNVMRKAQRTSIDPSKRRSQTAS